MSTSLSRGTRFRVDVKGLRAVVTGASSGIGAELARQLAAAGADVILVARRKDRLEALAAELRSAHGGAAEVLALDLGLPGAGKALWDATEGAGKPIDILINNAGFGSHGAFLDLPLERTLEQLQLNLVTLTESCHHFGHSMKARGRGHILNVASIGAWLSTPNYATYTAGKAYVRNFSEALAFELRPMGVVVSCLCPGPTDTEFVDVAGHAMKSWQKKFFMDAGSCARIGLEALFAERPNVIAGASNKAMMFTMRFLPRRTVTWISARMMGS